MYILSTLGKKKQTKQTPYILSLWSDRDNYLKCKLKMFDTSQKKIHLIRWGS